MPATGKRHGRRVKAVVHQPLRDIGFSRCRRGLNRPQVEDHLVRHAAVRPRVEHRIVRLEPRLDVVGVQDRVAGGVGHAVAAEHPDVGVRNQQDARAAPRRRGDTRESRAAPPVFTTGCPGRYGARCAATPIGPMPGPPPPCGMLNVLCRFRWQTSAPIAPGSSGRPARSCWRRPCTPGRRARARSRRCPGCSPRTRRASTDR